MIYQLIAFIAFLLIVIGFTVTVFHAIFYAPFVPTPHAIVKKMVKAARIKNGKDVIDLGAGDGRIIVLAAEEGANATGYELSWVPFLLAKIRIAIRKSRAKIFRKNFMKISLRKTDCVFCYLWPRIMVMLQKKFETEMKKGTRIISYCFPIKQWKPIEKIPTQKNNKKTFLIYVYEIGISNK